MDYGVILRRAWRITWDNKYLWWLGFLTALVGGRRVGGSLRGLNLRNPPGGFQPDVTRYGAFPGFDPSAISTKTIVGWTAILCLIVLLGLAVWVLSTIARGGLISATNQIEDAEQASFREGWQSGLGTLWRMLGVSAVQGLPSFIFLVGLILLVGLGGLALLRATDLPATDPSRLLAGSGVALACAIPLLCILFLVSLALSILRPFADRACVMEDERVFASYRRGWEMLRGNFGDSLVLGIISVLVRLVIGTAVSALFLLPVIAAFGGIIGGAAGGFVSYSNFGWVFAVIVVCGSLVILALWAIVSAVMTTYFSSMWTLAYRQFLGTGTQADLESADAPAPV